MEIAGPDGQPSSKQPGSASSSMAIEAAPAPSTVTCTPCVTCKPSPREAISRRGSRLAAFCAGSACFSAGFAASRALESGLHERMLARVQPFLARSRASLHKLEKRVRRSDSRYISLAQQAYFAARHHRGAVCAGIGSAFGAVGTALAARRRRRRRLSKQNAPLDPVASPRPCQSPRGSPPPLPPQPQKGKGAGKGKGKSGPPPSKAKAPAAAPAKPRVTEVEKPKEVMPLGRKIRWVQPSNAVPPRGSIFGEIGDNSGPGFDQNLLTAIFAEQTTGKARPTRRKWAPRVSDGISVLDTTRAQNAAIMLSKLRMTPVEVCDCIQTLDTNCANLGLDDLELVTMAIPTPSETQKLLAYKSNWQQLRDVEQKMMPLCTLSRARVKLMKSALSHSTQFSHMLKRCRVVQQAAKELRCSEEFRELLQVIIKVGNFINHGEATVSKEGVVRSFAIESLQMLSHFKAGSISALHFLCFTLRCSDENFMVALKQSLRHTREASHERLNLLRAEVASFREEAEFARSRMEELPGYESRCRAASILQKFWRSLQPPTRRALARAILNTVFCRVAPTPQTGPRAKGLGKGQRTETEGGELEKVTAGTEKGKSGLKGGKGGARPKLPPLCLSGISAAGISGEGGAAASAGASAPPSKGKCGPPSKGKGKGPALPPPAASKGGPQAPKLPTLAETEAPLLSPAEHRALSEAEQALEKVDLPGYERAVEAVLEAAGVTPRGMTPRCPAENAPLRAKQPMMPRPPLTVCNFRVPLYNCPLAGAARTAALPKPPPPPPTAGGSASSTCKAPMPPPPPSKGKAPPPKGKAPLLQKGKGPPPPPKGKAPTAKSKVPALCLGKGPAKGKGKGLGEGLTLPVAEEALRSARSLNSARSLGSARGSSKGKPGKLHVETRKEVLERERIERLAEVLQSECGQLQRELAAAQKAGEDVQVYLGVQDKSQAVSCEETFGHISAFLSLFQTAWDEVENQPRRWKQLMARIGANSTEVARTLGEHISNPASWNAVVTPRPSLSGQGIEGPQSLGNEISTRLVAALSPNKNNSREESPPPSTNRVSALRAAAEVDGSSPSPVCLNLPSPVCLNLSCQDKDKGADGPSVPLVLRDAPTPARLRRSGSCCGTPHNAQPASLPERSPAASLPERPSPSEVQPAPSMVTPSRLSRCEWFGQLGMQAQAGTPGGSSSMTSCSFHVIHDEESESEASAHSPPRQGAQFHVIQDSDSNSPLRTHQVGSDMSPLPNVAERRASDGESSDADSTSTASPQLRRNLMESPQALTRCNDKDSNETHMATPPRRRRAVVAAALERFEGGGLPPWHTSPSRDTPWRHLP